MTENWAQPIKTPSNVREALRQAREQRRLNAERKALEDTQEGQEAVRKAAERLQYAVE